MRFERSHLFLLLLAGALGACKETPMDEPVDAGPPDTGEAPDGCSETNPCPLASGTQSMGELISPVGDEDRYTFEVNAAGSVVNVLVTNDADFSPIRLEVVLFGPDGMSLANARYQMNGKQKVEIQKVVTTPGTYAVVVRDVGSDAQDRSNKYYVTITVLGETDTNEPNESYDVARMLTPGTAVNGSIGFQGDHDWFKIDVGANQLIQVDMSAPGLGPVRMKWELYDPTGLTRLSESLEPTEDIPWPTENRAVGNASGTYYIHVIDFPDDGQQAELSRVYTLTVRLDAEPDVQDLATPNETPPTGTVFTPGNTLTGYIAATSDADYYKFTVTGTPRIVTVTARMTAVSPVDIAIQVLASNGRDLICEVRDGDTCRGLRFVTDGMAGPGVVTTSHVVPTDGTYYVKVSDFQDNDFDTNVTYTINIDLPVDPDTHENYGFGRQSATTIAAMTASGAATIVFPFVDGYISHANDEDWYRFDIPGPGSRNGDWQIQLELQVPGPTPVETEAFWYGESGSVRESYGGYGQSCREPNPNDLNFCQWPDAANALNQTSGAANGDCFVVFREVTAAGPHYFRMSDLDRDDYDIGPNGRYHFRVTATTGCPVPGVCEGIYEFNGMDLCGR